MISEWVENKVVFWGRPLKTEWNTSSENEFSNFHAVTQIEVLESVKGKTPRHVNVYHSMNVASCGIIFYVGSIELFTLPIGQDGVFSAESDTEELVDRHLLFAYFDEGEDIPLREIGELRTSFYMDNSPCENDVEEQKNKPSYCKWENKYFGYSEAYSAKILELEKATAKMKWWQKYKP